MTHRLDITGLRAVAVLSVFLFHAKVPGFEGGFLGVDVFFVISGFLIATMLHADLQAGRFSLVAFLYRRARRIIPALYAVLLIATPFAWLWLFPDDLSDFAKSLREAVFFHSNIGYAARSSYSEATLDGEALIHTWSLGVEGQFYVLFPVVFAALFRLGPRMLFALMAVLLLSSLGLMLTSAEDDPISAFFLFRHRAWEFLAGALVALVIRRRAPCGNDLLVALGLGLILGPILGFRASGPVTPEDAILPVVGTCLVLAFAAPSGHVVRLLSLSPLTGLGLISYSLYLWHQPVLVFARSRQIEPLGAGQVAAAAVFVLLASYLSWRYVEEPYRGRRTFGRPAVLGQAALVCSALLAAFGFQAHVAATEGGAERFPPEILRALAGEKDHPLRDRGCITGNWDLALAPGSPCRLGPPDGAIDFLFIGDSFAEALAPGLSLAASDAGHTGVYTGIAGCPPIKAIRSSWWGSRKDCATFKDGMIEAIAAVAPSKVILHGLWGAMSNPELIGAPGASRDEKIALYKAAMQITLKEFRSTGADVYVILSPPKPRYLVPERLAKSILSGNGADLRYPRPDWSNLVMSIVLSDKDVTEGVVIIDPADFLCSQASCAAAIAGIPLYRDGGHLTGTAARVIAPMLRDAIWP